LVRASLYTLGEALGLVGGILGLAGEALHFTQATSEFKADTQHNDNSEGNCSVDNSGKIGHVEAFSGTDERHLTFGSLDSKAAPVVVNAHLRILIDVPSFKFSRGALDVDLCPREGFLKY